MLRARTAAASTRLAELPGQLPVRVLGGTGKWFRVRLPTGEEGYAAADVLEPIDEPPSAGRRSWHGW
ncbi:MAG: hypothetical protein EXR92_05940 [Gemmatimonadetes bacterium]|nr:hypothetical protein [Gemmatimonadota bacterium]